MKAFAKINLTLRVLGQRTDGYHELRTTFQSLALHDTLTFTTDPGPFRIDCDDPACPFDRANLVWRAAALTWRAAGRRGAPVGVRVSIEKRIPMQAGLGGGSSDAAAALRALAALWRVTVSDDRLRQFAAELGADVGFFLEGGTALGVGRGDVLYPLVDPPAAWVVLALPAFGVSTKEAYEWFNQSVTITSSLTSRDSPPALAGALTFGGAQVDLEAVVPRLGRDVPDPSTSSGPPRAGSRGEPGQRVEGSHASRSRASAHLRSAQSVSKGGTLAWPQAPPEAELRNDLQSPIAARHPEINQVVGALRRLGASYAAMSGSGSAVFGLFATRAAAARAAAALGARTRRAMVTRTLNRAKYQALARPR